MFRPFKHQYTHHYLVFYLVYVDKGSSASTLSGYERIVARTKGEALCSLDSMFKVLAHILYLSQNTGKYSSSTNCTLQIAQTPLFTFETDCTTSYRLYGSCSVSCVGPIMLKCTGFTKLEFRGSINCIIYCTLSVHTCIPPDQNSDHLLDGNICLCFQPTSLETFYYRFIRVFVHRRLREYRY